jgi:hypothetical protein
MRAFALYAAATVIAVALMGAIGWGFLSPAAREVLLVSAALAVAVQLVAFGVARRFVRKNVMLGWGLGSLLRLVVLVVYAILVAKAGRAPVAPALLSFVTFLFVTTVFEPVFLKQ